MSSNASNHAVWVHLEQRVRALLDLKELITYATRPSSAPTLRQTTDNSYSRCSPLPQLAFTGTLESVLEMHPEPPQRDWKTNASSCICPRVTLPLDQESQNVEPTRGEKAKTKNKRNSDKITWGTEPGDEVSSVYTKLLPSCEICPPPPITCASSILSTMKESTETSLYSYIWREKNDEMCIFHAFYHRYIYSWGKCIISQVTKLCRFSHK